MDDRSDRGPEIECTGIRNGVIGVDKADFHAAYLYFVTVMNFVQGVIRNVVFFEFPFNEAAYQFRCVHGARLLH